MKFAKPIFTGLICLLVSGCQRPAPEAVSSPDHRPNVLFLFADDQAFDTVRALGHPVVETPNLDRLVREGFTFTHAFNQGSWSGAVCVVSRAMLNSGRYIYRARDEMDEVPLWGEVFGEAGYSTFLTGKWHNGDETAVRSFQHGKSIGKGMFETKGGRQGAGYRRPTPSNNSWSPSDTTLLGHWTPEVKDIVDTVFGRDMGDEYVVNKHTSQLYADQAIAFLEERASQPGQPFFMYVAFNAPHDPRQAPREFLNMYPTDSLALPPNYAPEHPFDQGERNTLRDEILAPFPRTEWAVKTHMQEYYAIISHMDQQIGRVLDRLEELGLDENTYIIFTADHGLAVGQHGLMGKQNQYDHSIRVPLVLKGPGISAGASRDELVYLQSIYPTTLELAGVEVPRTVEFRSLKPLIDDSHDSSYEAIFGSYKGFQRMIRTDKYKLIVYPEADEVQLFDMGQDPFEMINLAADEGYESLVDSLYDELKLLQLEVGDTLTLPTSAPIPVAAP